MSKDDYMLAINQLEKSLNINELEHIGYDSILSDDIKAKDGLLDEQCCNCGEVLAIHEYVKTSSGNLCSNCFDELDKQRSMEYQW